MKTIADRIALVTGAGRGLGAAIARAFAREGARVAVNYRASAAAAHALADEIGPRAIAVEADVRDPDAVRAMVDEIARRFGRGPDVVVCNALSPYSFDGEARRKADEIPWGDFDAQLAVALRGTLNVVQAALPFLEGDGRVVAIGTNLLQNPVVPYHDYVAAKAALLAFVRTASVDLGPKGIAVNMVSGGLLRVTDASAATPDAIFDMIAGATPLRRVTTPEELADAVLFFASPWARAVTGQNLVVDGGLVKD